MKKEICMIAPVLLASLVNAYAGFTAVQGTNEVPPKILPRLASDVFLSSPSYNFEVQFNALFLQPSSSNLHYAAEAIPLPAPSPNWKIYDIHPDFQFGFDVGIGGVFSNTHSTLNLDWEHFHSNDSASKKVSASHMVGPFFEIGPDASTYKKAHGRVVFHFDAINLDYGVLVNFGKRLQTNLFGGVGFVRIKQSLSSNFADLSNTTIRNIKTPSRFVGAGPQIGLNFDYCITRRLNLTGETLASLFVGTSRNHTRYKAESPALALLGISPANYQRTNVQKHTRVVPGFKGSLALAYSQSIGKSSLLKLEAGYQAEIYLNAIESIDMGSEVDTPPVIPDTVGVFARTFQTVLSNFALAGPYVKLMLGF